MKHMDFQYKQLGDEITMKIKDWRRVTKFLTSQGVLITENFNPKTLKLMKKKVSKNGKKN